MTFSEIKRFFEERVTYKPGYKFYVLRSMYADTVGITVVSSPLPDADGINPDLTPVLYGQSVHPEELRSDDDCRAHASLLIRGLELHEVDEWLRVDGLHVKDPHPEKWTLQFKEKTA